MIKFNHITGGNLKKREWSIILGALSNDFNVINEALREDPTSINDQDEKMGVTALHIAAADGNLSLVKFLCSQPGCNPLVMDYSGRWPNYIASVIGRNDIAEEIDKLIMSSTSHLMDEEDVNAEKIRTKSSAISTVIPFKPRSP